MNHFIKNISVILLILNINITLGQITHGVILYERKTNLLKNTKDQNLEDG